MKRIPSGKGEPEDGYGRGICRRPRQTKRQSARKEGADAVESVILGSLISFALLPLVLTDQAVLASTPSDLFFMFLNGLCATVAWLCFAKGIRTTPALQANFIAMLEPVMAPIWTFLLLSETPTVWSLIGCVIVIVTLLIYNTRKAKTEQA